MNRRIVAVLLIMVLVCLTFSACGKKASEEAAVQPETQNEETKQDADVSYDNEDAEPEETVPVSGLPEKIDEALISLGRNESDLKGDKLILVLGNRTDSLCTVTVYQRDENGGYSEIQDLSGLSGVTGKYGLIPEEDKREGDGCTPMGIYDIPFAFGSHEDPGLVLEYKMITEDTVFVDDPESGFYNTWALNSDEERDWNSAENLMKYSEAYEYALTIGYNMPDAVPGMGSVIILHCRTNDYTAGCVAIDREKMKEIMMLSEPGMQIMIAEKTGDADN